MEFLRQLLVEPRGEPARRRTGLIESARPFSLLSMTAAGLPQLPLDFSAAAQVPVHEALRVFL